MFPGGQNVLEILKNNNTDVNVGTEISELKRKMELVQKSWLQLLQALDALWRKSQVVLSLLQDEVLGASGSQGGGIAGLKSSRYLKLPYLER